MASVFKAYHAALDRYVAIKVLHPAFMEDENFQARFQREARVVARLEHPNIVPVYDFSEHENRPFLVMKFIEGETLKARLSRGPLSPQELLKVVDSVGAALSYAHQHGVLHRDVKPSNVLLSNDGTIFLADFGLARMAQSGESSLTSDRMVGTPQYISPEQALSVPDLDARTDVYSFGIMLYEIMVGRAPYNADTPFAIVHDHIYTPLPMPRQINPQVSEPVERVLLKALAKNREDRFSDIPAMVQAFHNAYERETLLLDPNLPIRGAGNTLLAGDSGQTLINPASTAGSASQPSGGFMPPSVQKPTKNKWMGWVLIASAVVAMLILGLVLLNQLNKRNKNQIASQTQTVMAAQIAASLAAPSLTPPPTSQQATPQPTIIFELSPTPDKPVVLDDKKSAQTILERSVQAWKNGNMDAVYKNMNELYRLNLDTDYHKQALDFMSGKEAWLVAAIYINIQIPKEILNSAGNTPVNKDMVDRVHEIYYKAAGDKLSDDFFTKNKNNALTVVAQMRYQFLYGNTSDAQKSLDNFMGAPVKLKRFPEARLLQAENQINAQDNNSAKDILNTLLKEQKLPDWVIAYAGQLQEKIK
jgi:serine/threonine protein kinase